MIDKEKVIKGVECCIKMGRLGVENCRELDCPYFDNGLRLSCWIDVLCDALELLKEDRLKIASEVIKDSILMYQGKQIIRCKECKWRSNHGATSTSWLPCMDNRYPDDWFCANGEKE